MSAATVDPIVISGMAVAAGGGVDSPASYWSALRESRELMDPLPRDRGWPVEDMLSLAHRDGWSPVPDAGGFLRSAADFDPVFFNIGQREATVTDPQIRVAMRVAWQAVENAGMNPGAFDGEDAGCFVGELPMEYGPRGAEVNEYTGYRMVGLITAGSAGRVAHCLGFRGPSASVDTACASSLTALHLAASAVRNDDCEWALAGGVCVMASPTLFYEFSRQNAIAPDGHCRAFSAQANGTVWGEGCGFVVLERESRARRMGHRVFGRLLASQFNHTGKGTPILAPRGDAQARLIRKVIDRCGVDPADIGYIEGHGTATRAGDPAELTALHDTYGAAGCGALVGSVKSNLGHAQAASGMLGLIKLLLAGWHGQIPATLFAEHPTAEVDWERSPLRLAAQPRSWQARDGIRYGAVSAFGATGVNGHAILAMPAREENDDF